MKIMVTGAGALLGQGIIRSLKCSSLGAEIVSVDPSPLSAGLYWTDRRYRVPVASDPNYLDRIRELLDKEHPDAVLVGTDVELPMLAAHRTELESQFSTSILVSDSRVVEIADDKYLTAEFMRKAGFAHPRSCLPGEEDQLIADVGFPLIVKPRFGARSIGMSLVSTQDELVRVLEGRDGLVIQECVGTDQAEFTASALVFDGVCRAIIVMRRDLRDGNTYRAFVDRSPDLTETVRTMSQALQPYGPVNFQFRLDREGTVKVFEINARFSGTTPLRARANFNEVEMCLRHILLGEPVRQPEIRDIIILRHWSETVVTEADIQGFV